MTEQTISHIIPRSQNELPPQARLLLLSSGKRVSQVVYAVAELGLADHISEGPRTAEELAELTGSVAAPLRRLLRCAAAIGLVEEIPEDSYGITDLSRLLCSDAPSGQRDMVLLNGRDMLWKPYGEILHTLRTGAPAFEHVFGRPFFEYLEENPEDGDLFDRAMTQLSRFTGQILLQQYDFAPFSTVVDVGGGQGTFLTQILNRHHESRGVLVDRPETIAQAGPVIDKAGLTDRVELREGDFFGALPDEGDLYVLKAVLHDWSDEPARRILTRVREAMGDHPERRLIVCDQVMKGPNEWDHAKFLDLDMMLRFDGRERGLADWTELLSGTGLEICNTPVIGGWSVIECRVARS
ncbi:methyltransferase [Nocardiopsis alba]|uniref:methyltransferase n=1 Tax=Nocardiopsis alba TaxID=53437 RepID=UPI0033B4AF6F